MSLERRYGKNMLIGIAILAVYGLAQVGSLVVKFIGG